MSMAKYSMVVSGLQEIEEVSTTAKSKIKAGGKVAVFELKIVLMILQSFM